HKFSQMGPALAVADVNGDGLDDFFVGGAFKYHGTLFTQTAEGKFSAQIFNPEKLKIQSSTPTPYNPQDIPLKPIENVNKLHEDASALFFDADNDGDNDLYVASGSYEFGENTSNQQDRLYINDGKGNFKIDTLALPKMLEVKSCVKAIDFDGDGDLDLFVGGRVVPAKYPMATRSYILRNDTPPQPSPTGREQNTSSQKGKGLGANTFPLNRRGTKGEVKFTDITAEIAPELLKIGMVTDALWTDYDNDQQPDLVIVGEFMPITFLKNQDGKLITHHSQLITYKGWWNSLVAGDFDNDGDTDYAAGNLGLNSMYKATENEPITILAKDFDGNGSFDPVLSCFMNDSLGNRASYPMHSRDDMIKQMLFMRRKFPRYANYGKATTNDLFSKDTLQGVLEMKATYFQSSYIENQGNGKFAIKPLHIKAQFAPVFGMKAEDIDQDGNLDLLLVGNDYGNEVFMGRMDAFYGLYLKGDGKGNFAPVPLPQSGFVVPKDGKALVSLFDKNGKQIFIASQNKDKLRTFGVVGDNTRGANTNNGSKTLSVVENPTMEIAASRFSRFVKLRPDDTFAEITFKNGKKRKVEFYYGDSYFSQSSRSLKTDESMSKILIYNRKGEKREGK
ncbi:MAG: VCBS repeat-containing protein, partial [Thermoflexibacter sp.]|nr:VCBS repeat-containing protein [Thermoflexibacter sp.]